MAKVLIISSQNGKVVERDINISNIITWFDASYFSTTFDGICKWNKANSLVHKDNTIILKPNDEYYLLDISRIIRIENISNESCIYIEHGLFLKTRVPINIFEDVLEPHNFLLVHSNHLINVKHLKSFVHCNAFVTLSNSDAIPVNIINEKKISDFLNDKLII